MAKVSNAARNFRNGLCMVVHVLCGGLLLRSVILFSGSGYILGWGGGDFAAEAGALFFCKRKNAQKAPLAGSGVFCAFNLYGDRLKKDGLSLCVRCEFTAVAHGVSILS